MTIIRTNVIRRAAALLLCAAVTTGALAACGIGSGERHEHGASQSEQFDQYLQEQLSEAFEDDLLSLRLTVRDPRRFGIKEPVPTLGRLEWENAEEQEKELARTEEELLAFDPSQLTDEQKRTYSVLKRYLEVQRRFDGFSLYYEPNTATGIQSSLPILLAEYPLFSRDDVEQYLTLLADVDGYLQDLVAYQQERSRRGLFMADFALDDMLEGLNPFVDNPEENCLLETFEDRVADIEGLTEAERAEYLARNREVVQAQVFPAYRSFMEGMRALRGTGKNGGGLCNLENGQDYYAALVAESTGSTRAPAELDLWLDEKLLECLVRMSEVFSRNPGIEDRLSNECGISDPKEILLDLEAKIASDFPRTDRVEYQISPVHPSLEASLSPAMYLTAPFDRPAENRIYINGGYSLEGLDLYTTLAHEGYPGHLYQHNYFLQQQPAPIRLILGFNGYSEGWGSYAELTGFRFAPTSSQDAAELLRLNTLFTLLIYCKADIGVHHYGWDTARLKDYLYEATGQDSEPLASAIFRAVVEDPGNYLSYGVGCAEFLDLRADAEQALGERFDPVRFHQAVLEIGPAPFDLVREAVDQMILEVNASAGLPDASLPNAA